MELEQRLFLIYDDKDFAEWIQDELSDYGRFIRSLDSLDFFFPQWEAVGAKADVVILPEATLKSEESFLKIYRTVKSGSPDTVFLIIYYREKDQFIQSLETEGNVCISFDELDTGLLEKRLKERNRAPAQSRPNQTVSRQDKPFKESHKQEDKRAVPEAPPASEPRLPETLPTENRVPDMTHEKDRSEEDHSEHMDEEEVQSKQRKSSEEQRLKLQRIKERIVIEEKIVTVHVPVHFNSKLISFVSLYPRAGATFVCSNFGRMLGEHKVPVAVMEPVLEYIGSTYYELMHGETNAPKDWISWPAQIQRSGYITQEKSWYTHGVNWIPSNVDPTPNWNEGHTMQLLLAAKKYPVTLCDISSHYDDPRCKKILSMSDEIWIVADGDPVQLNHYLHKIDDLKSEFPGKQMKVIGNRWGDYIKQNEWKDALLLPTLTQIPDLGNVVLKLAWEGKLAWDDAKLKNTLAAPFKPLARSVVAKEMYALMKKDYGLGAKVRRLFNQMSSLEDESKSRKF
ncbi:hypothetical protein [Cohnella soli]|uniref:Uncharacterized protein n=1 Tax=Cohnella soli TaxID=425005 RepID=A0ABW0HMH0_9BACL